MDDIIRQRLKKDGYKIGTKLGVGTQGSIWDIGKSRVLKMTPDKSEAEAMALIMKKPHKNVVKIYRVWMYRSINTEYKKEFYFIEQERLKKEAPEDLEGKANDLLYKLNLPTLNGLFRGEGPASLSDIKDTVTNADADSKVTNFIVDVIDAAIHLFKQRIAWGDFFYRNVMYDGKKWKLIDLGVSNSPGKVTDIREMKLKEAIKLDVKVGDTVLMGRFKNKRVQVKSIGYNEKGDLKINGRPALKFRLLKKEKE